jgi:hypothetical protein
LIGVPVKAIRTPLNTLAILNGAALYRTVAVCLTPIPLVSPTKLDFLGNAIMLLYIARLHPTVRVWYSHILNSSYGDVACQIVPIRPSKAESNVVKALKAALCSSCDGVLLK